MHTSIPDEIVSHHLNTKHDNGTRLTTNDFTCLVTQCICVTSQITKLIVRHLNEGTGIIFVIILGYRQGVLSA